MLILCFSLLINYRLKRTIKVEIYHEKFSSLITYTTIFALARVWLMHSPISNKNHQHRETFPHGNGRQEKTLPPQLILDDSDCSDLLAAKGSISTYSR